MPAPVNIKKYGLSAGIRYSSGSWHGAWDIPCPTGTPVVAAMDGVVLGCNTGVPVNQTGGSGSPSNWANIYTKPFGKFSKGVTAYYQHLARLAPGVRTGKKVKAGQVIGWSDNTGNSSGPHLHFHIQRGKRDRYDHYMNHGLAVYPPSAAYKEWDRVNAIPAAPATKTRDLISKPVKPGETSKAVAKLKSWLYGKPYVGQTEHYGNIMKAKVKKIQKKHGLGTPDGVIGPKTWAAIKSGKR